MRSAGHDETMRLSGFVPLVERGFALPLYEGTGIAANAVYRAIPKIEGDHLSPIAGFDAFEGPASSPVEKPSIVSSGDPWRDVFVWDDRRLVGTVSEIYEALADKRDALEAEAPLTLLEMSLAVSSPDTRRVSAVARGYLERLLGRRSGARGFRDAVVRPGVALEIRRCLHRHARGVAFGESVGFDAIATADDAFNVVLDGETLRRFGEKSLLVELREAVARFGQALGLGIELLEPPNAPPEAATADPAPPPQPASPSKTAVIRRGSRSRLFGFAREMALDLGTNNTRVLSRGGGVILSEPSVIALRIANGVRKVVAVGEEARLAYDRAPSDVEVTRPLREGVIVDLDAVVAMLTEFMHRIRPSGLFRRPIDLIVCLPAGSTSLERHSLHEAAVKAGASEVWMVEAPLAAALGANLPVEKGVGSMLVQVGGGTTEVATIAFRRLVYATSTRVGGDAMDDAILNYIRRHHNLLIGLRSAERLKREIGSARKPIDGVGPVTRVRGRDLVNGVPKEVMVSTAQIEEAISDSIAVIVEAARTALENMPPELAADVFQSGMTLAGGGALLPELDALLAEETGIPVRVADDPANCVTLGLGRMLEDPEWRAILHVETGRRKRG